jgi:NAD(P)-dependent dehydrogenase (short-subunit alcohol dehydrogenase family)
MRICMHHLVYEGWREEMEDRIVIVTGANSGIGKAASMKFAREGWRVVMACRNVTKGERVRTEIMEETGSNKVELLGVDLASMTSIRDFCRTFQSGYDRLDVLIHNAGHFDHGQKVYPLSPDGIELTFAINTVGPFLMTRLLLDSLKESPDARVIHACSTNIRHYFDPGRRIDFDNLQGEYQKSRKYSAYKMYGDSKMALLMLTFDMAKRLEQDRIRVNAVQIPAIRLSKETMGQFRSGWNVAARIQSAFGDTQESMADTYYHIAASEEFRGVTGRFISDRRETVHVSHYTEAPGQQVRQFFDKGVYPRYADDPENRKTIWNLCIHLTDPYAEGLQIRKT